MTERAIGGYIRTLRLRKGLTQKALAQQLHVTDKAVSKWERELSYPDILLLPKLAQTLGVSVGDLIRESDESELPARLLEQYERSADLRAPLHIILGCTDLLTNRLEDQRREQQEVGPVDRPEDNRKGGRENGPTAGPVEAEIIERYLDAIRISGEYLLSVFERGTRGEGSASLEELLAEERLDRKADWKTDRKTDRKSEANPGRGKGIMGHDLTGRRILVVEDIAVNREIAAGILKRAGADVEFANDGQNCLDLVAGNPSGYYDLILMDIMMPVMDGVEATKGIRQMRDTTKAKVPIVAMTANTSERDRKLAFEAGMDAFTEKPFSIESLLPVITRFLR